MVEGKEHMVCKLKGSIYMDLNRLPDNGILSVIDTITFFNSKENVVDRCIYLRISGSKFNYNSCSICSSLQEILSS